MSACLNCNLCCSSCSGNSSFLKGSCCARTPPNAPRRRSTAMFAILPPTDCDSPGSSPLLLPLRIWRFRISGSEGYRDIAAIRQCSISMSQLLFLFQDGKFYKLYLRRYQLCNLFTASKRFFSNLENDITNVYIGQQ